MVISKLAWDGFNKELLATEFVKTYLQITWIKVYTSCVKCMLAVYEFVSCMSLYYESELCLFMVVISF